MKKKILFSYYLKKLAQMEQKLLGIDDERVALLAVVLTKATLFRRFHTGCTTQELCFCNPWYVQELFVYLCLNAKENGRKLREQFSFVQSAAYNVGMCGQPCIEDREITAFLEEVFPQVTRKEEIDNALYATLLPDIPKENWEKKFNHISNFRNVNIDALYNSVICKETELVDAVLAEMKDDKVVRKMLSFKTGDRCDIYGKSFAYRAYFPQMNEFPKVY